jgi:hypothetical protein
MKQFIKDLRLEIKENRREMRHLVRIGEYAPAAHLDSVNGALEYVIYRLENTTGIFVAGVTV